MFEVFPVIPFWRRFWRVFTEERVRLLTAVLRLLTAVLVFLAAVLALTA